MYFTMEGGFSADNQYLEKEGDLSNDISFVYVQKSYP